MLFKYLLCQQPLTILFHEESFKFNAEKCLVIKIWKWKKWIILSFECFYWQYWSLRNPSRAGSYKTSAVDSKKGVMRSQFHLKRPLPLLSGNLFQLISITLLTPFANIPATQIPAVTQIDWPFVIITVKTLNFHGKFWEFKNMVSGNLRSRSASNDKLLFTIIVKKICRWCFRTPVLFYYYPTIHLLLIPMSICTSQSLLSHPYVVNELLDRHCDAQNRHRN
jgi:hypothetical protein